MAIQYPVGQYLQQVGPLLQIDPNRVLRRVGLSATLADEPDLTVNAETYFRLWDAAVAEANRPDIEMDLAMSYAHGPFLPPIFAFSCADTIALGLKRLADFKRLIVSQKFDGTRSQGTLRLEIRPSEPGLSIPPSLALFELLYITECARCFSGSHVVPLETSLPAPFEVNERALAHLERRPITSSTLSLVFSAEDADRPLITRSASLWETLEPGFLDQLEKRFGGATMAARIKRTLTETLPGGTTSVDAVAKRLNVSKRSLQRRLREECTSY